MHAGQRARARQLSLEKVRRRDRPLELVRPETLALTRSLSHLRADLLAIVQAGIRAVDPGQLLARAFAGDLPFAHDAAGRGIARPGSSSGPSGICLAIGKAAHGMAQAAAGLANGSLHDGLVVAPEPAAGPFPVLVGAHPVPTAASEAAGRRALALAGAVGGDHLVLVLLSGGASSLVAVPAAGVTLVDKARTTETLLRSGAPIAALNTVRKHLSAIKGGWLAASSAARVVTFAISDVVGDDLSVIGSGPTVGDPSTFADALAVIETYGGIDGFPAAVVSRLRAGARGGAEETPKPDDRRLARGTARVIGGRSDAMQGAAVEARARGYLVQVDEAAVAGEARVAARSRLAEVAASGCRRPACVISSGETVVHVTGSGRGGRNQEFALAAADLGALFPTAAALASVGTDGRDGPTDAAGAVVDSTTLSRAHDRQLTPADFLDRNDSYSFFQQLGDLIHTGPTGTNVGDLQVLLLA